MTYDLQKQFFEEFLVLPSFALLSEADEAALLELEPEPALEFSPPEEEELRGAFQEVTPSEWESEATLSELV